MAWRIHGDVGMGNGEKQWVCPMSVCDKELSSIEAAKQAASAHHLYCPAFRPSNI